MKSSKKSTHDAQLNEQECLNDARKACTSWQKREPYSRANSLFAIALLLMIIVANYAATPPVRAQTSALETAISKSPNPELIGSLTKELSVTPEQATGGAGALFGLAKSKLSVEDFSKVSKAVPGMDGLLKATPKPKSNSPLDSLASSLPGSAGGLASVASSFKSLGLSSGMAEKFVPVMTQYVQGKGGSEVASLLEGALK